MIIKSLDKDHAFSSNTFSNLYAPSQTSQYKDRSQARRQATTNQTADDIDMQNNNV